MRSSSSPRSKMGTGTEQSGRRRKGRRRQFEGAVEEVDAFSEEELARRPEVRIINKYAVVLAYFRIGMKGIGALALLWATVVLLGGFVSVLTKKDFAYLTVIAFVQATGLSDATGDGRFTFLGEWFDSLQRNTTSQGEKHHHEYTSWSSMRQMLEKLGARSEIMRKILVVIFLPVLQLAFTGPAICVVLSAIRVAQQDYGIAAGDTGKANLKPALNLFYYASLVHGAIYTLLMSYEKDADSYCVRIVSQRGGFSPEIVGEYLQETKEMCVNNPASTKSWNLITYGAGLLDSQLPEEYARGGRVLTMLIDQDILVPITRLLIRSQRQRIQKLIGTLGWRDPAEREMRWLAARIVEHIAGHLNLAQYPGALECVSSLLDASCHDSNGEQEALHLPFEIGRKKARKRKSFTEQIQGPESADPCKILVGWILKNYSTPNNGGGTQEQESDEDQLLVLPGLRILDKLAGHNGHNCTVIYNAKVLLSKLVAPVSSDAIIQDIASSAAWAKVVDGSLKVVTRLMGAPGNTGKEMRGQIAGDTNAVKNLVAVLDMDMKINTSIVELQIGAIEALTQLALHQPADSAARESSKEDLIERTLHIFLTNDWMEDYMKDVEWKNSHETESQHKKQSRPSTGTCMSNLHLFVREMSVDPYTRAKEKMEAQATDALEKMMEQAEETASRLKEKAGEALAKLLSMETPSNSEAHKSFVMRRKGVVQSLTELLGSSNTTCIITSTTKTLEIEIRIGCRINAAVILKHLSDYLEEPTLRKVLIELLTTQAPPSYTSTPKCWPNKSDQENPSDGGQQEPPTLQNHTQISEERRLQAELLSLVAAFCASKSLNFASLLLQPQLFAPEDVVVRLKQIVDDNRYATPACLAILKIVSEMVIELIPHDGIVQVIEKHDVLGTLLKASKRVAGLESSMLFAGVDRDCYGVPLKPLSSVLVKRAKDILTQRMQELGGINVPAAGS